MFLMTLFSALCLLTSSIAATIPSLEIVHQHHIETTAGKTIFLTEKLVPYVNASDELNREIQALSKEIRTLSPQDDQQKILAISEKMAKKMDQLLTMLPVLNIAQSIDEDFQQLDLIIHQTDPLSPEQQQVIDRIDSLCRAVY